MTDALLLRPRLLNLEQVREVCGGIGRDLALQLIHAAGPTKIGRRIFVSPDALDRHLEQLRQEQAS